MVFRAQVWNSWGQLTWLSQMGWDNALFFFQSVVCNHFMQSVKYESRKEGPSTCHKLSLSIKCNTFIGVIGFHWTSASVCQTRQFLLITAHIRGRILYQQCWDLRLKEEPLWRSQSESVTPDIFSTTNVTTLVSYSWRPGSNWPFSF